MGAGRPSSACHSGGPPCVASDNCLGFEQGVRVVVVLEGHLPVSVGGRPVRRWCQRSRCRDVRRRGAGGRGGSGVGGGRRGQLDRVQRGDLEFGHVLLEASTFVERFLTTVRLVPGDAAGDGPGSYGPGSLDLETGAALLAGEQRRSGRAWVRATCGVVSHSDELDQSDDLAAAVDLLAADHAERSSQRMSAAVIAEPVVSAQTGGTCGQTEGTLGISEVTRIQR